MDSLDQMIAAARADITRHIDQHGIQGVTEIARSWGISRQRVQQLTAREDFPKPIIAYMAQYSTRPRVRLWLATELAEWHSQYKKRIR